MNKALIVTAVVLTLGAAVWAIVSGDLHSRRTAPQRVDLNPISSEAIAALTAPPCTPDAPCRIRILFAATRRGLDTIAKAEPTARDDCDRPPSCLLWSSRRRMSTS